MANPAATIAGLRLIAYDAVSRRRPRSAVQIFASALRVADQWADADPVTGGVALIKLADEVRRIGLGRSFWLAREMRKADIGVCA